MAQYAAQVKPIFAPIVIFLSLYTDSPYFYRVLKAAHLPDRYKTIETYSVCLLYFSTVIAGPRSHCLQEGSVDLLLPQYMLRILNKL